MSVPNNCLLSATPTIIATNEQDGNKMAMMEMKLANPVNQAVIIQAIHGMMPRALFQNTQNNKP